MCLLTPRWHVESSRAGPPCHLGGACALGWGARVLPVAPPRTRTLTMLSFQAPTITVEGFLQALSLAVDKQFEDRKKLSSCV